MKNPVDYTLYECPYSHLEKECGHELQGPEGYENTYGVWCACGFRGPAFYLDPTELKLKLKNNTQIKLGAATNEQCERSCNPCILDRILQVVNKQAEDEGLWFIAETASESYLQEALRELHRIIEDTPNPSNEQGELSSSQSIADFCHGKTKGYPSY